MELEEAKAILIAHNIRFHPDASSTPGSILFAAQRKLKEDTNKRKIAVCSRRAGKTTVAVDALIEAALQTPAQYPYIALTRESAKRIAWGMFEDLLERYNVSHKANESDLSFKLDNKSIIFLYGADQKDLISRLRGPKYGMAVIDEGQSFRPTLLNDLVYSVLDAGLQDLNGPLWLLGTPGPVCVGDFYEWSVGKKKGFSSHHWTVKDNPHLDGEAIIKRVMETNGWELDNPTLQREWMGLWVEDPESRLFKFTEENIVDTIPEFPDPHYIIGIDWGHHDATAFSVVMYSEDSPNAYVVHSEAHEEMLITDAAERIKALKEKYRQAILVADTGGLGKSITEEVKARTHLHIKPAEKKDKATFIKVMNDSFRQQRLFVYDKCVDLIHQLRTTQIADDGLENRSQPFDECDASIYSFREAKHYIYEPKPKRISVDSEEFMRRQEELEAEQLKQANEKEWWE